MKKQKWHVVERGYDGFPPRLVWNRVDGFNNRKGVFTEQADAERHAEAYRQWLARDAEFGVETEVKVVLA